MTGPVHYKQPRRLNVVTVVLLVLAAWAAHAAYQLIPAFLVKQEVYRVLEEHGSHVAGRAAQYASSEEARDALRNRMHAEARRMGIEDPKSEAWIEIGLHEARLGIIYSSWYHYPFGVLRDRETVHELERVVQY